MYAYIYIICRRIYIYIYIVDMHILIHIYIYIYRERDVCILYIGQCTKTRIAICLHTHVDSRNVDARLGTAHQGSNAFSETWISHSSRYGVIICWFIVISCCTYCMLDALTL